MQVKKDLDNLHNSYARAMEFINTPLDLGTKEELIRRLWEGMIFKDQLSKANQALEEYKDNYVNVVPTSMLEENKAMEE